MSIVWCPGGDNRPYSSPKTMEKDNKERIHYIRKASNTVEPSDDEEKDLFNLANRVPFDDRVNHQAELEDLNITLIQNYLKEIGSSLYEKSKLGDFTELCSDMNIISTLPEYVKPKNVGLMFFCMEPDKFFPCTQIDIVQFPDGLGGDNIIENTFKGPIHQQLREALQFIKNSIVKMLQDFAEKCGRSADNQLHLMLISHKEITSYIDRASKAMVDGWRGVSERFRHVYLNNNFTQTYEIIAAAIEKDQEQWSAFVGEHDTEFQGMKYLYSGHPLFSDTYEEGIDRVIYDCYPLHPVSTFILPRLSERVAQNERTLFTFISATGESTLSAFLKKNADNAFELATPDLIYDYFEPLLKQEVYSGNLHKYYILTSSILRKIDENSLDAKIVKTISLIYILEQFEKLRPTVDELNGIFAAYGADAVNEAVKRLVEDKYVVYLKRSNSYLRLKETSGVDIRAQISNIVEKRASKLDIKAVLNESNFDHYLYPSRYNDEKEMTRYFDFRFIDSSEVSEDTNWAIKRENIQADGVVFAIIPEKDEEIEGLRAILKKSTAGCVDCVFVIPNRYQDIRSAVSEFDAVQILMQTVDDDPVLFEDYEVVYEDLRDVLRAFIEVYTRPERRGATYFYNGSLQPIL